MPTILGVPEDAALEDYRQYSSRFWRLPDYHQPPHTITSAFRVQNPSSQSSQFFSLHHESIRTVFGKHTKCSARIHSRLAHLPVPIPRRSANPAPIRFSSVLHKTRARFPMQLLFALVLLALVKRAVAQGDESQALSYFQTHGISHATGCGLKLLFLIGHCIFASTSSVVGPLMGVTSILWLMMRNDAAVSPKVSWM